VCATRVQQWQRVAGCARVSHLWAAKAAKRAEWPLSRLGRPALAPTRRAAALLLVEISSQGKCCARMSMAGSEYCVRVQQTHVCRVSHCAPLLCCSSAATHRCQSHTMRIKTSFTCVKIVAVQWKPAGVSSLCSDASCAALLFPPAPLDTMLHHQCMLASHRSMLASHASLYSSTTCNIHGQNMFAQVVASLTMQGAAGRSTGR
jgi:hypothetical protein